MVTNDKDEVNNVDSDELVQISPGEMKRITNYELLTESTEVNDVPQNKK